MPIRFLCEQCGQRLSIARRKSGAEISCPACGQPQRVPEDPDVLEPASEADEEPALFDEESPEAVELGIEAPEPDELSIEAAEAVQPESFELELLPAVEVADSGEIDLSDPPEPPAASPPACPPPLPPPLPKHEEPDFLPAAPRRMWKICLQATLLVVVAAGAFMLGYHWDRRGDSSVPAERVQVSASAAREPEDGFADVEVLLEARICWMPDVGEAAGDEGATFLALPANRVPSRSLPTSGLQPGGDGPDAAMDAIDAAGGTFARAEADGTVAAVLPREGVYHVLLVSQHVVRTDPVQDEDLVEMKQYFADPEELIGEHKYVWRTEEIRVGFPALEHDFGLDGL